MPRRRKVALVKGPKRIKFTPTGYEIAQTLFCGECGKRTKQAVVPRNAQVAKRLGLKRYEEVARVCLNVAEHKDGKKYFWPQKDVIIPMY